MGRGAAFLAMSREIVFNKQGQIRCEVRHMFKDQAQFYRFVGPTKSLVQLKEEMLHRKAQNKFNGVKDNFEEEE